MSILEDKPRLRGILNSLRNDHVLVITGQSGAGKDTLVKSITSVAPKRFRACYVGTGEEFRRNMPKFSRAMRRRIQSINDAGELQDPLNAVTQVVNKILHHWNGVDLLILEGSPRTKDEAVYLYKYIMRFLKRRIVLVNLVISDELSIKRMEERNEKDRLAGREPRKDTATPEARQAKAAYYHEQVVPAVEYLEGLPRTEVAVMSIRVDEMSIREVLEEVLCSMPDILEMSLA